MDIVHLSTRHSIRRLEGLARDSLRIAPVERWGRSVRDEIRRTGAKRNLIADREVADFGSLAATNSGVGTMKQMDL